MPAEEKLIKPTEVMTQQKSKPKKIGKDVRNKSIVRGRPPESLMQFTGFTMYKLAQHIFETTNQHLASNAIKGRSFCALHVLINDGPSTQQALCDGMWIDRATMVAVIDELENKGLVERQNDPSDRRVHRVSVTSQGRKFHFKVLKDFRKIDDANFASLSGSELSTLRSLLERLMSAATLQNRQPT